VSEFEQADELLGQNELHDHSSTDNLYEDNLEDEPLDTGTESKRIVYQLSNPTIQSLHETWKEGDLILDPEYQRRFVWNKQKASNLIESIILNIPLPLIYTAEVDEKEEVIDGQQRLTSIFAFVDGHFPDGQPFKLSKKLKLLSEEIGGKSFAELDKRFQKEIKRRSLQIISITEDSQEDVKFEMFERLNTNITALNAQELRNCLYQGRYNDFLKRMADYEDYQYIIDKPKYRVRMRDVENVLMFCAFYHTTPDRFSRNLTQLLNQEMRSHRNISDEQLSELEHQFKKSVQLIKHVWGNQAFNIYSLDTSTKQGEWSKQLNQGLFQILMYWFTPYDKNQVIPYSDLLREELLNLQIHNAEFRDTLTGSGTNSPINVRKKFDIWGSTIKGILQYPRLEPRAFSYQHKRALWDASQTCQLCGQQIATIDDAEVDHITCYWEGGKTVPENARLTHRLCNRKRGGGL
jgi:hypothetical protein